jgi:hypothetical protein
MINDQANGGIRKPARRRTKRGRPRETKHRRNQPTDAPGNQQQQNDQEKVSGLGGPELLQHQQEWEEHFSEVSPSRIMRARGARGSAKKQAPFAHVSRFGSCTNGVEICVGCECKSLDGKSTTVTSDNRDRQAPVY